MSQTDPDAGSESRLDLVTTWEYIPNSSALDKIKESIVKVVVNEPITAENVPKINDHILDILNKAPEFTYIVLGATKGAKANAGLSAISQGKDIITHNNFGGLVITTDPRGNATMGVAANLVNKIIGRVGIIKVGDTDAIDSEIIRFAFLAKDPRHPKFSNEG